MINTPPSQESYENQSIAPLCTIVKNSSLEAPQDPHSTEQGKRLIEGRQKPSEDQITPRSKESWGTKPTCILLYIRKNEIL